MGNNLPAGMNLNCINCTNEEEDKKTTKQLTAYKELDLGSDHLNMNGNQLLA